MELALCACVAAVTSRPARPRDQEIVQSLRLITVFLPIKSMGDDGEGTDPVPPTEGTGTREADGTLLSAAALRQITDAFTAALRSGGPSTLREPPVAPSEGHSSGGKLLAHYSCTRPHPPPCFVRAPSCVAHVSH